MKGDLISFGFGISSPKGEFYMGVSHEEPSIFYK